MTFGETHSVTLQAKLNLANLVLKSDADGLDRARVLYDEAVRGWATLRGWDHVNTASAQLGLAAVHRRQGRTAEARELLENVIKLGQNEQQDQQLQGACWCATS